MDFWVMLAVAALVYFALSSTEGKPMPWAMLVGAAAGGLFPSRLHDLGASGWWATVPAIAAIAFSIASYNGALILAILAGTVFAGVAIALAILPGQPGANRFGPPPGRWFRQA